MANPLYIDISAFQPTPNAAGWAAYRSWAATGDPNGVARIALKATEGIGFTDTTYQSKLAGARAAGIVIIHYHYARPDLGNDPVAEAQYMASVVKNLGPSDVIMLDFEENASTGTNADWAYRWLSTTSSVFGRTPVIYASLSMVQNRLQDSRLTQFPLILAQWTFDPSKPPNAPAPWSKLYAWQFSDALTGVPGFPVPVDANVYLAGSTPQPLVLHNGCVLDLQKSYQLDGGSQDKCGPWSVSELRYAGLPGSGPRGSASDVQHWAHAEYEKWIGPDVESDQNGSSIDNMHEFLTDSTDPKSGTRNLHWNDITSISPTSQRSHDIAEVIAALKAGYPVLVTVNEQSVIRSNGTNPYPWQPALGPVNHIFTVVGYTSDGYFLVDDELNAGDGWPDKYSQSKLEIHWASIVQVIGPDPANPWLAPIPSGDPLGWPTGFNAQNFGFGGFEVGVPSGWKLSSDGKTLTAPNGVPVIQGFEKAVIGAIPQWDSGNVPLSPEHHEDLVQFHSSSFGGGQVQYFRDGMFWYTDKNGVIWERQLGAEIYARTQALTIAKSQLDTAMAAKTELEQQVSTLDQRVADLTAKIAELEAAGGGITPELQAVINSGEAALSQTISELTNLDDQIKPFVKE